MAGNSGLGHGEWSPCGLSSTAGTDSCSESDATALLVVTGLGGRGRMEQVDPMQVVAALAVASARSTENERLGGGGGAL